MADPGIRQNQHPQKTAMNKLSGKPPALDTRAWPFTAAALTAGLRRHFKDPNVLILDITASTIPQQRSSLSMVRGLEVICKTSSGTKKLQMVVKQVASPSSASGAKAGWREHSLYAHMKDFIPLKIPTLVAADPHGEWMVMNLLPGGRLAENWGQADYMLSIEHLALLHEKFWNLGEDLTIYNWLGRPLSNEREYIISSAEAGLQRLWNAAQDHPLFQDLATFDRLVGKAKIIADRLGELPPTLLHGDFWPGNLIIYPDKTLYAIDWELAAIGPGILDLVTFVQKSLWQFEKLPTSIPRLAAHYRGLLSISLKIEWKDQVWNAYWDHAVMWLFLSKWMGVLGRAPVSMIGTYQHDLERVWMQPLRAAVDRWLR